MTISKDENWQSGRAGTTEVYKDNDGQQVLRRVYNLTGSTLQQLSTYYVYDDLGNLSFVLPPGSMPDAGLPTQATLDNLGFQYQYDSRNRLVQKKIPGKGWEYLIYNAIDQVVATQDANQRALSQWVYTKYDAMGRVVLTGLYSSTSTRPALQSVVDGQAIFWETPVSTSSSGGGYTSAAWPVNAAYFLTINYYDTYTIAGLPIAYSAPSTSSLNTRSLLTASQTNILGTTNMLWMVPYYDDLGRIILSYQQHNQGGGATLSTGNYDLIKNQYNFSNQDTATTRQHYNVVISKTAAAITVVNSYVYDHLGRKRQTWETINGGTKVHLSQLDYNELGQPMTKHLHSETGIAPFLQDVGYTYNERGWLRTQGNSSNLFSLDLRYNTADNGTTQQYNGNIAEMLYMGTNSGAKTFQYQYDPLNRLTSGVSTGNTMNEAVSYDLMGNITSLTPLGSAAAVLAYTYQNGGLSNQLQAVTKGGDSV